jgi:hypothetical protein
MIFRRRIKIVEKTEFDIRPVVIALAASMECKDVPSISPTSVTVALCLVMQDLANIEMMHHVDAMFVQRMVAMDSILDQAEGATKVLNQRMKYYRWLNLLQMLLLMIYVLLTFWKLLH